MKITPKELKQIIKEEYQRALNEMDHLEQDMYPGADERGDPDNWDHSYDDDNRYEGNITDEEKSEFVEAYRAVKQLRRINPKAISEEVSIPCILYNVPSRTSLNMDDETTVKLSELKNIIGIKEASNDLDQITRIINNTSADFKVWSGNDNETLYIMAAGGYGIVSVAGHIVSTQINQMIGYLLEGNIELAGKEHRRLLELFNIIFVVTNPIPIRYYVKKSGFDIGSPRLPMTEADSKTKSILDESIKKYSVDLKFN